MWPFKKKELSKPKEVDFKATKKISYRNTTVNIGVIDIGVQFGDGRNALTKVYGYVEQKTRDGKTYVAAQCGYVQIKNPEVEAISKSNLLEIAQTFIRELKTGNTTIVDDFRNPKKCSIGDPISAKIIRTSDYEIDFQEAYLEDL